MGKSRGRIMRAIVAAWAVCLAGCSGEASEEADGSAYELSAEEASDAADAAAGEADRAAFTPAIPSLPPLPAHNYDDRNGLIYSYVSAVSEEDRKRGKAVGDVVSFAYLGRRSGKHTLAQVDTYGRILGYSYCSQPCRIITNSDGTQFGYSDLSIIGAAFADAIAGRLEIAQENEPRRVPPATSTPTPSPASIPSPEPTTEPSLPGPDGQPKDTNSDWPE
jgi:hypothetical protein